MEVGSKWRKRLFTYDSQESKEGARDQRPVTTFKGTPSDDLLLPVRPHLLTFLPPPKTAPLTGVQVSNT
jgi:hypothetical protein